LPDPSGRRGWAGWLRRTGLQYAGPPVVTDVRLVADESDLVAAMPGAWGFIGCDSIGGVPDEFTGVIFVAGARGAWVRISGETDPADSLCWIFGDWLGANFPGGGMVEFLWNVAPAELVRHHADPRFPIESRAWTGNSNGLAISQPSVFTMLSGGLGAPGFHWSPRMWVSPGRALLVAQQVEDPTVFRVRFIVEEPGSEPGAP
jgi:hypothetical protein